MNAYQDLWWQQASSDHSVLMLLLREGAAVCHKLHYLQMATEKIAKAYLWRSGSPPPKHHAGFVQFLRSLGGLQESNRLKAAKALGFKSSEAMQSWVHAVMPLAYALERIAPALANDGPNPEYPWPHNAPTQTPVSASFEIWNQLVSDSKGRRLFQVIELAIKRFDIYG